MSILVVFVHVIQTNRNIDKMKNLNMKETRNLMQTC